MTKDGVCFSSKFKTVATYGRQAIHPTELLQVYVNYFRRDVGGTESMVFLTTHGTPVKQGHITRGKYYMCSVVCNYLDIIVIYNMIELIYVQLYRVILTSLASLV